MERAIGGGRCSASLNSRHDRDGSAPERRGDPHPQVHVIGAVALHARSLTFLHPVRYEPVTLTADLPRPWRRHFAHLIFGEGKEGGG